MSRTHPQDGMILVIGPNGVKEVSEYYTRTKEGRDAMALQGYREYHDVIPPKPEPAPPIPMPEPVPVAEVSAEPMAQAAPMTQEQVKRAPGRPRKPAPDADQA